MSTGWNSQVGGGMYAIQFETDDPNFYKIVKQACEAVMDAIEMNKRCDKLLNMCPSNFKEKHYEK